MALGETIREPDKNKGQPNKKSDTKTEGKERTQNENYLELESWLSGLLSPTTSFADKCSDCVGRWNSPHLTSSDHPNTTSISLGMKNADTMSHSRLT